MDQSHISRSYWFDGPVFHPEITTFVLGHGAGATIVAEAGEIGAGRVIWLQMLHHRAAATCGTRTDAPMHCRVETEKSKVHHNEASRK